MAAENEDKKHLPKADLGELDMSLSDEEVKRRLTTYIPQKGEHAPKFLFGLKGDKVTVEVGEIEKKATVFIAKCEDTEITLKPMCTKIMMHGCKGVKLTCAGVVLTNTLEVWNSNDITIEINEVLIATLQIDVVNNVDITFSRKKLFHKLIWAAVGDYTIRFKDDADATFCNGYQKMVARYPDEEFQEKIAQFIDSLVDGQVVSEKLLRLQNGFPTTEKEQSEFDRKSEKNRKIAEEHYRGLVDKVANDEELKKLGIKTIKKEEPTKKAAKPNDKCPLCPSGQKYKKCCGNPAKKE
jgi:hypothetical protein